MALKWALCKISYPVQTHKHTLWDIALRPLVFNFSANTILSGDAPKFIWRKAEDRAPQVATGSKYTKAQENWKRRHLVSVFLQISFHQVVHRNMLGEKLEDRAPQFVTERQAHKSTRNESGRPSFPSCYWETNTAVCPTVGLYQLHNLLTQVNYN